MKVMLDEEAIMPTRAHDGDAGLDLYTPVAFRVPAYGHAFIDTGVKVQIPYGYVGLLKSKSGLNFWYNLTGEGVVDYGYNGTICVKLYNNGDADYFFDAGDKIIQLVVVPCGLSDPELVDHFEETERGNGGFGSTGK